MLSTTLWGREGLSRGGLARTPVPLLAVPAVVGAAVVLENVVAALRLAAVGANRVLVRGAAHEAVVIVPG
eukprot:3635518-Alexandrium_andersonii.AAC.1